MGNSQAIKCKYKDNSNSSGNRYSCYIKDQSFAKEVKQYEGDEKSCAGFNFVTEIFILNCEMPKIPQNFPWTMFSNLSILHIRYSQLTGICRDDFRELCNLSEINLDMNKIEHLPGDLFVDLKNLKKLSVAHNKIKFIDAPFIDLMVNLNYLDLRGNYNIDLIFDRSIASEASIERMKNEILTKCQVPDENLVNELRFENAYENLAKVDSKFMKKKSKESGKKDQNDITNDLKVLLKNEKTKDFNLIVRDKSFKVHKFLLIARSPVLAEMIEENPEASNLKLEHIPLDIFQHVLSFLYNDTLPQEGATFKDIFIAAGRLQIEKLKNYTGVKLIDQVNTDNAFEMLNLANKYNHEELRSKAFGKIKEIFPGRELKDEIAKDEENIQKLYKLKRKQDEFEKEFGTLKR